jgi:inosine-uridine nucleoside N-ribohydrolase
LPVATTSVYAEAVANSFPNRVIKHPNLPDAVELYRQILAAQPDHSVVIVSIGFLTNISNLLRSGPDQYSSLTGVELVNQKS